MKSLDEIKLEIAKANCFCDWAELLKSTMIDRIEEYWTEAAVTYANQFTERGIIIVGGQRRGLSAMMEIIAAHPKLPLIIANVNHNPEAIKMHGVDDLKELVGDWPREAPIPDLSKFKLHPETIKRIDEGRSKYFGPKPTNNYRKK